MRNGLEYSDILDDAGGLFRPTLWLLSILFSAVQGNTFIQLAFFFVQPRPPAVENERNHCFAFDFVTWKW